MIDIFGNTNPKKMPRHLFGDAVYVDYDSAIPGNPAKQNFTVCPRHWYVDATFRCRMCGTHFVWSAEEQKRWFEEWGFWIDSHLTHCPDCRKKRRKLKAARQEYDALVAKARYRNEWALKTRILSLIDEMGGPESELPERIRQTYVLFQHQLKHAAQQPSDAEVPDPNGLPPS